MSKFSTLRWKLVAVLVAEFIVFEMRTYVFFGYESHSRSPLLLLLNAIDFASLMVGNY